MEKIEADKGSDNLKTYLKDSKCYRSQDDMKTAIEKGIDKPCGTIAKYEASRIIVFRGITLTNHVSETLVPKLGPNMHSIINALKESIDEYFPEVILDKNDPSWTKNQDRVGALQELDHRYA